MLSVKVIETGSSGNCFLFNDSLIIDVGVPMSHLKDVDFKKITHILLTHIHGDHFHKTTLRTINQKYKHIEFVCGEWLYEDLRLVMGGDTEQVKVIEMNKLYEFGGFKIAGFHAIHNVPNCGYRLVKDGHKHFHVTDISTLYGLTATNYDSATIECNYEDNKANELIQRADEDGEFSYLRKAMRNHLSVYEVVEFVKANNIKRLIPVHISGKTKDSVVDVLKNSFISERLELKDYER